MSKVFIAPYGSVFPTDSNVSAVAFTDFRELVAATNELSEEAVPPCLIPSNIEVLRLAIKYAEYFKLEFVVLEGVPGGGYDMMWDQVIYPLDRISFPVFDESMRKPHNPIVRKNETAQTRAELARFEVERPALAPKAARPPRASAWESEDDEPQS